MMIGLIPKSNWGLPNEEGASEWEHSYDIAPSINIAVPTRYLHSHNGVIHRDDFASAVRLVTELVRRLTPEAIALLTDFE